MPARQEVERRPRGCWCANRALVLGLLSGDEVSPVGRPGDRPGVVRLRYNLCVAEPRNTEPEGVTHCRSAIGVYPGQKEECR